MATAPTIANPVEYIRANILRYRGLIPVLNAQAQRAAVLHSRALAARNVAAAAALRTVMIDTTNEVTRVRATLARVDEANRLLRAQRAPFTLGGTYLIPVALAGTLAALAGAIWLGFRTRDNAAAIIAANERVLAMVQSGQITPAEGAALMVRPDTASGAKPGAELAETMKSLGTALAVGIGVTFLAPRVLGALSRGGGTPARWE